MKKVLPPSVSAENIYVTLGSPWIPTDVIKEFIDYILGNRGFDYCRVWPVKHDEVTGTWEFDFPINDESLPYKFKEKYGTKHRNGMEILLRTLNQQSLTVSDSVRSSYAKSGKQSVVNKEETVLAQEKQKLLIETFKKWIWTDKWRKETLERVAMQNFRRKVPQEEYRFFGLLIMKK